MNVPNLIREAKHGEVRLLAVAPDRTAAVASIDRTAPGAVLVTVRRARLEEGPDGRALVPLSAPIGFPLEDPVAHLRAVVAALEARDRRARRGRRVSTPALFLAAWRRRADTATRDALWLAACFEAQASELVTGAGDARRRAVEVMQAADACANPRCSHLGGACGFWAEVSRDERRRGWCSRFRGTWPRRTPQTVSQTPARVSQHALAVSVPALRWGAPRPGAW